MPPLPMHPRTRVLSLGIAIVAVAAAACESYEPPCEPLSMTRVLEEPQQPNTVSTMTGLYPHGDAVVATWLTFAAEDDASTLLPRVGHVAVVQPDGTVAAKHAYKLFQGMDPERVPEDNVGFCWTRHGLMVHWTQDTTASEVGDPPSIRTSLHVRRLDPHGAAASPLSPLHMSCVDCDVRLAAACHQQYATVAFAAWRDDAEEPEPLRVFSWDLAADQSTSGPVDWLDAASSWPAPGLRTEGDFLFLITTDRAWVVDAGLRLRGGPLPLPNAPDRRMHWSGDLFEGTVVWSRPDAPDSNEANDDVLLRRYDGHGHPLAPVSRLGASAWVAAMTRQGDTIGLIVRDDGHDAFAWTDLSGERIGGDVPVGPVLSPSRGVSGMGELLRAVGRGRFAHWVAEPGRIERKEIVCER